MHTKLTMGIALVLLALPAFGQGSWRLEVSGGPGTTLGSNDRTGDFLLKTTVEYEIPATPRCTLGLRMLPLFIYDQEERGENTVFGAGLGIGGRIYWVARDYRGLFAEANVHALGHKNHIAGNSSNINFLTGVGLGYQFSQGWHTVLKWGHISNANLGRYNTGADVVTLGVGYRF